MPAIRSIITTVENTAVTACVFCGDPVTGDNCVDWTDEGLGGISHEVCPETLLDNVTDYAESFGDSGRAF